MVVGLWVQAQAMGQGDPSMFDPMAVPANAPMNPSQGTMPTPPMMQAMTVGQAGAGAGGPVMDMAQDGPPGGAPKGNWFQRNGEKIGDAMMGAGAALQSIDNPQGAAALVGLLRSKKQDALSAYEAARLGQFAQKLELDKKKDQDKPTMFGKKSQEKAVTRYMEIEGENEAAQLQLTQLDSLEKNLNADGIYTGPAGSEVNWLKSIGAVLTPDNQKLMEAQSSAEAVTAIQNQMALGLRSPKGIFGGLTGNTSDRDVKFLIDGVAGLNKLPGANKKIMAAMRRIYARRIDYNNEAAKWIEANGEQRGLTGLVTHMNEWNKAQGEILKDLPGFETSTAAPGMKTPGGFTITPMD
jgi:hypothetical protein